LKEWRENFDITTETTFITKCVSEVVGDIISNVRTPTPPLPDLEDL